MTATPADAAEVIRLWPDGPPSVIEGVPAEVEFPVKTGVAVGTTFVRNISDPTLTVFTPLGPSKQIGVIVAPGGGWTINAWSHEGVDVARWLASHGYTAFLLKYRVRASHPDQEAFEAQTAKTDAALASLLAKGGKLRAISDLVSDEGYRQAREACADDGRRAIQIVREQASRFDIRPEAVGMIGFSAGAFLAVDVALDPRDQPLAFIAPIYGGETRGTAVTPEAPPLFAAVAQDDFLLGVVEGLYADWSDAGRPTELHVFRRGAHGFGMAKQGMPSDGWPELFLAWLEDLELPKG
jgi:acetyl esterase/lipase